MVAVGPPVWLVAGPPGVEIDARVRLSPDGRTLAFGGVIGGTSQVYLRHLDQLGAVPLAGTEGTRPLAFSPDGRELLVADYTGVARNVSAIATVSRVSLTGGPLRTVAQGHGGAAWGPDDTVILGGNGLRMVGRGEEATQLTTLGDGERFHTGPAFLPGGRAVVFTRFGSFGNDVALYDFEAGHHTWLLSGTTPQYSTSGHLIFWRDGALWAVPFDVDRLAVTGDAVPVLEGVANVVTAGGYALADNGTLTFAQGGIRAATLASVSRAGEVSAIPLVQGWPRAVLQKWCSSHGRGGTGHRRLPSRSAY